MSRLQRGDFHNPSLVSAVASPQAYDIRFMTAEEQEELLEHWMVAADVRDVADEEEVEGDDLEDFVSRSE